MKASKMLLLFDRRIRKFGASIFKTFTEILTQKWRKKCGSREIIFIFRSEVVLSQKFARSVISFLQKWKRYVLKERKNMYRIGCSRSWIIVVFRVGHWSTCKLSTVHPLRLNERKNVVILFVVKSMAWPNVAFRMATVSERQRTDGQTIHRPEIYIYPLNFIGCRQSDSVVLGTESFSLWWSFLQQLNARRGVNESSTVQLFARRSQWLLRRSSPWDGSYDHKRVSC